VLLIIVEHLFVVETVVVGSSVEVVVHEIFFVSRPFQIGMEY
jgi:hypothetical protein